MTLDLHDYKEGERREPHAPNDRRHDRDGWVRFLIPILLAALVSYFTAQGTIQVQVATIRATEENHFQEVLRRLDLIQRWQDRQDSKRP